LRSERYPNSQPLESYAPTHSHSDIRAAWYRIVPARIAQSLIHIAAPPSDFMASVRFLLFFAQAAAMIWMGVVIATTAAG